MNDATPALPWAPIYSITRSGIPEISVQGIVYVWAEDRKLYANSGHSLLRLGDTRTPLWSRSLLKPFQLMALYPTLKTHYPQLTAKHYALMSASQSGDPEQQQILRDILAIGDLQESDLQCGACRPIANPSTGNGGPNKSPLNHPCAGKHLAHLLFQKARQQPLNTYLMPGMPQYGLLRNLLEYLLNKTEFAETVDGCGMPNYDLNAVEIAQLYHALVMPVGRDLMRQAPDELTDMLSCWDEISSLIREYPLLIGGQGRLDTRLMSDTFPEAVKVIAKEGADGLLAIGIGPNPRFSDGLGLLIKIASGYEPKQLERIAHKLLSQLELVPLSPTEPDGVLACQWHFELAKLPTQA